MMVLEEMMTEEEKKLVDEWRAAKVASAELEYWALNDEQILKEIEVARMERDKIAAAEAAKKDFFDNLKLQCGYEMSEHEKDAREIMGDNFLGIPEIFKCFTQNIPFSYVGRLERIPYALDFLRARSESHILIAGVPLSVLDIRKAHPNLFNNSNIYNDEWYKFWSHSRTKMRLEWHLLPIIQKQDQDAGYNCREFVRQAQPRKVIEVVYTTILYFLNHGRRLYEDYYVWCDDLDDAKSYGACGCFGQEGLRIARFDRYWMLMRRKDFVRRI